MADDKKILITGGTGTIGKALIPQLVEKGFSVRVFALKGDPIGELDIIENVEIRYGDITDEETVKGICEGVSTVMHLAAVVLSDDTALFDRVNVNGTRHLLADAKKYGVQHFIHISSASVVYRKLTP